MTLPVLLMALRTAASWMNLGAVPPFLHHGLHPLQVSDSPGQAVDHRPGVLVAVDMAVAVLMGDAVGVHVLMAVRLTVLQRHPCLFFLAHAASPFLCSFPEQMMM